MSSEDLTTAPLADRLRPRHLDELIGQVHLLAPGKPLRRALEAGQPHSMALWGPPGTGKTTLARMIAHYGEADFQSLSAVLSGVKEVRAAVERARVIRRDSRRRTVLFVDEVHRFNKAQQDAFLPHIEDGTLIFIGATTENPSFALNNALLSRLRVYVLKSLDEDELFEVLERALVRLAEVGIDAVATVLSDMHKRLLVRAADGDARRVLVLLELVLGQLALGSEPDQAVRETVTGGVRRFDKGGDEFYDQISALHKAVRGSNPDAALYWLARMLDGGCDPQYLTRRVLRIASEDIGNADPRALRLALDAWETYQRLGSPEGELAIAQTVVYLACAAKSNAVYRAFEAAQQDVQYYGSQPVPMHLRNAPTRLMKTFGYGAGYRYAHDEDQAYAAGERYFPDHLGERRYYEPVDRGLESRIKAKLDYLRQLDNAVEPDEK